MGICEAAIALLLVRNWISFLSVSSSSVSMAKAALYIGKFSVDIHLSRYVSAVGIVTRIARCEDISSSSILPAFPSTRSRIEMLSWGSTTRSPKSSRMRASSPGFLAHRWGSVYCSRESTFFTASSSNRLRSVSSSRICLSTSLCRCIILLRRSRSGMLPKSPYWPTSRSEWVKGDGIWVSLVSILISPDLICPKTWRRLGTSRASFMHSRKVSEIMGKSLLFRQASSSSAERMFWSQTGTLRPRYSLKTSSALTALWRNREAKTGDLDIAFSSNSSTFSIVTRSRIFSGWISPSCGTVMRIPSSTVASWGRNEYLSSIACARAIAQGSFVRMPKDECITACWCPSSLWKCSTITSLSDGSSSITSLCSLKYSYIDLAPLLST